MLASHKRNTGMGRCSSEESSNRKFWFVNWTKLFSRALGELFNKSIIQWNNSNISFFFYDNSLKSSSFCITESNHSITSWISFWRILTTRKYPSTHALFVISEFNSSKTYSFFDIFINMEQTVIITYFIKAWT